MQLKSLKLTNFRNFSSLDLDFSKNTLFIGNNAQGKSNLLESIYFLATTKSQKVEKDLQLIKEGEEFLRVEGEVEGTKLEIVMQNNQEGFSKRTKVNGIPRKVSDYIGNLVVVFFSPDDINLVSGPPVLRRWHIDLTLAATDKDYKTALNEYHLSLISRNRLLKRIREGLSKVDELEYWNSQVILNGNIISLKRGEFFSFLNSNLQVLEGKPGALKNSSLKYLQSEINESKLNEYLPREIAAANSLIGPHRDDFLFLLDQKELSFFGSRGETRTAVLDLKLAELEYIKKSKGITPILLLDDIFSELDEEHKKHAISLTQAQQTIISAVEGEKIPGEFLKTVRLIRVEQGKITSLS